MYSRPYRAPGSEPALSRVEAFLEQHLGSYGIEIAVRSAREYGRQVFIIAAIKTCRK